MRKLNLPPSYEPKLWDEVVYPTCCEVKELAEAALKVFKLGCQAFEPEFQQNIDKTIYEMMRLDKKIRNAVPKMVDEIFDVVFFRLVFDHYTMECQYNREQRIHDTGADMLWSVLYSFPDHVRALIVFACKCAVELPPNVFEAMFYRYFYKVRINYPHSPVLMGLSHPTAPMRILAHTLVSTMLSAIEHFPEYNPAIDPDDLEKPIYVRKTNQSLESRTASIVSERIVARHQMLNTFSSN